MDLTAPRQIRSVSRLGFLFSILLLFAVSVVNADQNGFSSPVITLGSINANGYAVTISGSVLAQSSPVSTLTWNWGDGSITTGSFPQSHTYGASPQTYTVIITATDSSGNTGTASIQLELFPNAQSSQLSSLPPQIAVDTPKVASDGETVTVGGFAGAAQSGESITSMNWNWGDGSSSSGQFPQTHVYTNQGSHQITITATDNNGNSGTITTTATTFTNAITSPQLIPKISATDQVSALTVTLNGNIAAQAPGAKIDWGRSNIDWGDGTRTSFSSFSHTYSKYQQYTISLNVYDTLGNYAQMQIPLNLLPSTTPGGNSPSNLAPVLNINIIQNGLTLKMTGSATVNPQVSGASIVQLLIDWGDGTVTNGFTQYTHTYSQADTYNIQITAIDSYGNKATVTQDTAVTPSIVSPGAGGTTSTTTTQCAGAPTITLNSPSVSGLTVGISGATSNSVTSGTINWGDSYTTPLTQYTHTYSATKSYTITVTVSDACGNTQTATTTAAVTSSAKYPPIVSATASVSGYAVTVTGTVTASAPGASIDFAKSSVNWGDGTSTPLSQYTHTYPSTTKNTAPITIVVTAIDTQGNTNTQQLSVTVPSQTTTCQPSTPTISLNQPAINGLQVSISGTTSKSVTGGTIDWGDGTVTSLSQYTHTYSAYLPYTIIVTVKDSCGSTNVARTFISPSTGVASPPTISVTASVSARTVTLTGTITASPLSGATIDSSHTTIDWGDHSITNYPTFQHTYQNSGTYTILIVATDTHGNRNSQVLPAVTVGSGASVSVT